jgi:flagellar hook assembly protein FlgD
VCLDAESNEGSDASDADFRIVGTAAAVEEPVEAPDRLVLRQSRPNPVHSATSIEFGLPTAQRITLGVYSVKGQLIKMLARGEYPAGYHTVVWTGRNTNGGRVAGGLYFYRLVADGKPKIRKVLLLD